MKQKVRTRKYYTDTKPLPITIFRYQNNFWKNFFKRHMVTIRTKPTILRWSRKLGENTTNHVLLDMLKRG